MGTWVASSEQGKNTLIAGCAVRDIQKKIRRACGPGGGGASPPRLAPQQGTSPPRGWGLTAGGELPPWDITVRPEGCPPWDYCMAHMTGERYVAETQKCKEHVKASTSSKNIPPAAG